jgi:hypothetical protein
MMVLTFLNHFDASDELLSLDAHALVREFARRFFQLFDSGDDPALDVRHDLRRLTDRPDLRLECCLAIFQLAHSR